MKFPRFPKLAPIGIMLFVLAPGLFCQSATPTPSATPNPTLVPGSGSVPTLSSDLQPVPYKADEFPVWSYDLRRGEIITVGAFPIAYLVTSLCFDLGRYIVKYGYGDPNYGRYVPFSANRPDNTNTEITGLIVAAVGVSVIVALIDFFIGQAQAAERQKVERQKKLEAAQSAAQIIDNPDPEETPIPDQIPEDTPAARETPVQAPLAPVKTAEPAQ